MQTVVGYYAKQISNDGMPSVFAIVETDGRFNVHDVVDNYKPVYLADNKKDASTFCINNGYKIVGYFINDIQCTSDTILNYLSNHKGEIFTANQIYEDLSPGNPSFRSNLATYLNKLVEKEFLLKYSNGRRKYHYTYKCEIIPDMETFERLVLNTKYQKGMVYINTKNVEFSTFILEVFRANPDIEIDIAMMIQQAENAGWVKNNIRSHIAANLHLMVKRNQIVITFNGRPKRYKYNPQ